MDFEEAEDVYFLAEAQRRLAESEGKALSEAEVMAELGITEEDIANAEDVEIE